MYVRMARFEGGTPADAEAQAQRMRQDMETLSRGETPPMLPREIGRLANKLEMLFDRDRGKVAVLIYCDTARDAAEVDRILDSMNPGQGSGRRVSAEIYEVVLEQSLKGSRKAA